MPWPINSTVSAIDIAAIAETHINGFTLPQISGAMDRTFDQAESSNPGDGTKLVTKIEAYMANILSYDAQLHTGAANGAMIQADVIKWSDRGNGQLGGLIDARKRYVRWVLSLLGLGGFAGNAAGARTGRAYRR